MVLDNIFLQARVVLEDYNTAPMETCDVQDDNSYSNTKIGEPYSYKLFCNFFCGQVHFRLDRHAELRRRSFSNMNQKILGKSHKIEGG